MIEWIAIEEKKPNNFGGPYLVYTTLHCILESYYEEDATGLEILEELKK